MPNKPASRIDIAQPSPFSLGHKVGRQMWYIVQATLFRFSPVPFHFWRRWLLLAFGAKIHRSARVYPSVRIWAPWNLRLDQDACLGPGVIVYSVDQVILRQQALVSQYSHLCTASHDYQHPKFPLIHAPIVIEQGAWVCADAFIGMGVTIGTEAVVGARSVVTRDMPARMVCAGFPCKPLKPRFAEEKKV